MTEGEIGQCEQNSKSLDSCCWNLIGSLFSVWGKMGGTLEKQKIGRSSPEKKDWGQGQGSQKKYRCQGNWRRKRWNGFRSVLSYRRFPVGGRQIGMGAELPGVASLVILIVFLVLVVLDGSPGVDPTPSLLLPAPPTLRGLLLMVVEENDSASAPKVPRWLLVLIWRVKSGENDQRMHKQLQRKHLRQEKTAGQDSELFCFSKNTVLLWFESTFTSPISRFKIDYCCKQSPLSHDTKAEVKVLLIFGVKQIITLCYNRTTVYFCWVALNYAKIHLLFFCFSHC